MDFLLQIFWKQKILPSEAIIEWYNKQKDRDEKICETWLKACKQFVEWLQDDEEEDSAREDEGELDRLGENGDEILEDDVEPELSTLMLELEEDSPKALLLLD